MWDAPSRMKLLDVSVQGTFPGETLEVVVTGRGLPGTEHAELQLRTACQGDPIVRVDVVLEPGSTGDVQRLRGSVPVPADLRGTHFLGLVDRQATDSIAVATLIAP